jgi:putative transposase
MKRSRGGMYYFVTTNTDKRQQIFRDPGVAQFFLNTLRYYKPLLGFKIFSYVVMPDHIHLLIEPNDRYDLSEVMKAIKGSFGRKYLMMRGERGKVWQRQFFEYSVEDEVDLKRKIRYIFENPVRRGIVENEVDYEFSSARAYLKGENDYLTDVYPV